MLKRDVKLQLTSNLVQVAWNGVLSDLLATSDVKQGGVLSPVIFPIYIDCLLPRLSSANVDCYGGTFCTGTLAYADDLVLLAPLHRHCVAIFKLVMSMLLSSVLTLMPRT